MFGRLEFSGVQSIGYLLQFLVNTAKPPVHFTYSWKEARGA